MIKIAKKRKDKDQEINNIHIIRKRLKKLRKGKFSEGELLESINLDAL